MTKHRDNLYTAMKNMEMEGDWIDLRVDSIKEWESGKFILTDKDKEKLASLLKLKSFDRICQFRIWENQPSFNFKEVENLGNENRGGYGSTGK